MRRPSMKYLSASVLVAGLAVVGLTATPALAAPVASSNAAAPADTLITATYPVTGSTYLKRLNTTQDLGPGTLVSTLDLNTGAVTGSLTLPPSTGSFKEFGFIPVSVTTELVADGPTTGTADLATNTVSTTSQAFLKITSLKIAGVSIPVGNNCQTVQPTTLSVSSAAGFTLLGGGNVTGTYTIPRFGHCGLATFLINLTIPGPDNTITLTLGAPALS
jgi:hypothetical protein